MSDPYWEQVKALFQFDGPNGGKRIFSENNTAVTVGAQASISTLRSKFGGSSLLLDGTAGSAAAVTTSLGVLWGMQDITLEGWIYPKVTVATGVWVFGEMSSYLSVRSKSSFYANKWQVNIANSNSGIAPDLVSTTDVAYEAWTHVAVTRQGSTFRLFINGNLEASATNTVNITSQAFACGYSNSFYGYMDEVRVTLGVARYVASFPPPTETFQNYGTSGIPTDPHYGNVVLHCHFDGENNSIVFTDRKGHTVNRLGTSAISTASVYSKFGGSCLNVPMSSGLSVNHADMDLGSGDFTVEAFVSYATTASNSYPIFSFTDAAGTGFGLRYVSSYNLSETLTFNGTDYGSFSDAMHASVIRHIAICREGTKLSIFNDGTRIFQVDIGTAAVSSNGGFYVGQAPVGAALPAGIYADELRITKGVARYSKNATTYTVPTAKFPDYVPQKLTGTVLDYDNTPLARTVRAFRRSDSMLTDTTVSNASTGAYELRATDMSEHYVVVFDDARNAMIYDHIEPVV